MTQAIPSALLVEDDNSLPFDDENQLPTPEEFQAIVDDYLNNLSPKKRDKALVDQHRYHLIQQVLRDPRNTAISTAQFRFWVKKMFQLQAGNLDVICHDNKPVAIKEHIYDILVRAHREAHHGGRDKTSALVRRKYSWIPKELVARFVRHCPFCITRRNGGQSPTGALKSANVSSPIRRGSMQRYDHYHHSQVAPYPHTKSMFDHAPPVICTPSIREDTSDFSTSSGPSSADHTYDHSPNYMAIPSYHPSNSPRRPSYYFPPYDRDDDDFLSSYSYEPTAHSSPHQLHAHASPSEIPASILPTQPQHQQPRHHHHYHQHPLDMISFRSPSPQHQVAAATAAAVAAAASLIPTPSGPSAFSQPSSSGQQDSSFFYPQHSYLYQTYASTTTPNTDPPNVPGPHDDATSYYPNMLGITTATATCDPTTGRPLTINHDAYLRSNASPPSSSTTSSNNPSASSSTSTHGTTVTSASSLHPTSTACQDTSSTLDLLDHHQQDSYFNADNNPLVSYANHLSGAACAAFGPSHL
ncbi:hypothetical protein DM01DRAFT_1317091 [Hesseltinella vesiculosa]|uniref:Integrase zinc-binding domain-containing protein n=1 Tax=Hesseltinella vesiculosa TaxID=101127 RepID=A0A1X2GSN3_9FUNG|nr:hypothetical protein DM01DRAFT_1317091 [Hesseltinella vesiculosa]